MEHFSEEHLNSIQEHLKNRLTKEEFIKAFEQVINLVLKIQKEQGTAIEKLEATYSALMDKMRNDNSMSLSEMKKMMSQHMNEYTSKHTDIISQRMAGVKDGKDADEIGITNRVIATLQTYFNELFGKLSSTETRNKLEGLQGVERLKISAIDGLEEKLEEMRSAKVGTAYYGAATKHRFIDDETPTGTINGSNKAFTILKSPITGSLKVFINGARMRITEDYTFSGKTITFTVAPPTGSILLVDYRY